MSPSNLIRSSMWTKSSSHPQTLSIEVFHMSSDWNSQFIHFPFLKINLKENHWKTYWNWVSSLGLGTKTILNFGLVLLIHELWWIGQALMCATIQIFNLARLTKRNAEACHGQYKLTQHLIQTSNRRPTKSLSPNLHITNKNVFLNMKLICRKQLQTACEYYKNLTPYNPKSFHHIYTS